MSNNEADQAYSDERFQQLTEAKDRAWYRCHHRTAMRLASEIKRAAKAARRLKPYVWALHTSTVVSYYVLDHEAGREAAVELIAVLESEDRARQIQPDLDMAEYEYLVSTVSSCAYDNLGSATAAAHGFNSEGVHDTIAEGIQVCRRTGKLECITCFREYATDVFRASDDLPMAFHHIGHAIATGNSRPGFDRRWVGVYNESKLLLLMGLIDDAEAAARRAWELTGSFHSVLKARLSSAEVHDTIRLLKGKNEPLPGFDGIVDLTASIPAADESPVTHLRRELNVALGSCLDGDHAAAIKTLTVWDRRLTERQSLELWFEVRLRLIAASLLAADHNRSQRLATQLESKARAARDWLTLRRLTRLLDPSVPISPIASVGPVLIGSTTTSPAGPARPELAAIENVANADQLPGPAPTPLGGALDDIQAQYAQAADDPAKGDKLFGVLLALGPNVATDPADVARMLELARNAHFDPARARAIWEWAEAIAAKFPRAATVLSMLGSLGDVLAGGENSPVVDRIDLKRIEQLFQQSLDLEPNSLDNFGRAAVHYARSGKNNEAERCLARCVRLDRGNTRASLWLAEIYSESERSHDALAVLDMALRAGSNSHEVAWRAAMLAHSIGQYESMLTYLDQYDHISPGFAWVNFYRASGCLWLGRQAEALAAIDEEERRSQGKLLHIHVLRACALSGLGRQDDVRTNLNAFLSIRLSEVDYLTQAGLESLFARLWEAAKSLPGDDPLYARLSSRLLASGLTPNDLFLQERVKNPKTADLKFFICWLIQPLDERWRDSEARLHGQKNWTAYRAPWGTLVSDESEAGPLALAWQARCSPLEAVVDEIVPQKEGYTDHPGVVWQGYRSAMD
jgi:tetratricopeptide (TPR) repeat protein